MKITITKEDIKNGRQEMYGCPIALAMKRVLQVPVRVFSFGIFTRTKKYDIPKKASKFVFNFDTKKDVKPFSFYLKRHHEEDI